MALHSALPDYSDNDRSLDFRHEDVLSQITQSGALGGMSDRIQGNSIDNHELGSNQEELKDDSTHGDDQKNNTKTLYHQLQPNTTVSLSRSISQETTSSRKAPIRAVFNDLPTAYLSITSKFARSRSQNTSGSLLEVPSEDDSIPLQDPQPPTLPGHQEVSDTQHVKQKEPLNLGDLGPAAFSLTNDRLPPTSSLDIRNETFDSITSTQSSQQASHLGFRNEAGNSIRNETLDTAVDDNGSTLVYQGLNSKTRSCHALLVPEDSTVDDIYRHYASSSIGGRESDNGTPRHNFGSVHDSSHLSSVNGLSTTSQLGSQAKPSALTIRKQRRVDRLLASPHVPPAYALPAVPTSNPSHVAASISQGLEQSSSYGDTTNLLEIAQQPKLTLRKATLSRSDGRNDLRFQDAAQGLGVNAKPSVITSGSHNPFYPDSNPPDVASWSNDIDCVYDDGHNSEDLPSHRPPPLERKVSQALRRASGFSVFSNGSASSSLRYNETFDLEDPSFKGTAFNKRLIINDTGPSNQRRTQKVATNAQGFYNERAIPSGWITPHQRNAVRVPINRNKIYPNSTPESRLEPTDTPLERQDHTAIDDPEGDANDWETVGESRFGVEIKDSRDMGGMFEMSTLHRTGSSIANTSNDGTASIYEAESDAFGSTERITQHPGTIQYSYDYRQRNINMSPTPYFPPVHREHKVNGYLAASTPRHPYSSPFSHVPRPLESLHANPFRSPPPENLTTPTVRRILFQKHNQRAPRPNHFPPSTKTLHITKNDDGVTGKDIRSISSAFTTTTLLERDRTYHKIDSDAEPAYPSPALSHSKRQYLSPINPVGRPDRPSSWRHLMVFGRGDKVEGYNADGTPDSGTSARATESTYSSFYSHMQSDGSIELGQYMGQRRTTNPREHQPLIKGPPGALYRGISRSQKDADPANFADADGKFAKVTSRYTSPRDYSTNALRPLSLLRNGLITPARSADIDDLSDTRPPGLAYRSSLATPRRLSWQQLYTKAQLKTMEEAAKADGSYDTSFAPNIGQGMREEPAHRELYDDPPFNQQLDSWTQEASARIDRRDKKRKLSNIFLVFCALFPPLLLLFALGRLDRTIAWWTKGEITAFGNKQKKVARILACVYGFALFVGLIVILVFRFTPPSQSAT